MTCTAERHTVVVRDCPHGAVAHESHTHGNRCIAERGRWVQIVSLSRDVCGAHAVVSGQHRHHDPETDAEWTDDAHGAVPDSSNRQSTSPSDSDCSDCKNTRWITVRGMGNVPCPSCN